jgi:hypothetical protein
MGSRRDSVRFTIRFSGYAEVSFRAALCDCHLATAGCTGVPYVWLAQRYILYDWTVSFAAWQVSRM